MDEIYEEIYNQYESQNLRRRSTASTLSKENLIELQKQEVDPIFYDFFTLFSSTNFEDLYTTDSAKITVNSELNMPVLIKVKKEDLHIQIGNKNYVMELKEEGMNKWILLSIKGKTMILYSEVYEEQNSEDTLIMDDFRLQTRAGAYWMAESGGVKGETGGWFTVANIAVSVAGVIATLANAPLAITLSIAATGFGLTVGQARYVTLYTIKYQSQRSDCRTYIRERKVYYQYNNYTGYLKTTYYQFHATRPDYAGGACTGYY